LVLAECYLDQDLDIYKLFLTNAHDLYLSDSTEITQYLKPLVNKLESNCKSIGLSKP
jgi:hypothetical protein